MLFAITSAESKGKFLLQKGHKTVIPHFGQKCGICSGVSPPITERPHRRPPGQPQTCPSEATILCSEASTTSLDTLAVVSFVVVLSVKFSASCLLFATAGDAVVAHDLESP